MKIHLYGDQSIVSSVAAVETPAGLTMIINTESRWVGFQRQGNSFDFMAAHDGPVPPHDCVKLSSYGEKDDVLGTCHVVFEAENNREVELLNGLAYEKQEKDQVILIKVQRALLQHASTLGEYTQSSTHKLSV